MKILGRLCDTDDGLIGSSGSCGPDSRIYISTLNRAVAEGLPGMCLAFGTAGCSLPPIFNIPLQGLLRQSHIG